MARHGARHRALRMSKTHFPSQKGLYSGVEVEKKDKCNKGLHGYKRNRYKDYWGSKAGVISPNQGRSDKG